VMDYELHLAMTTELRDWLDENVSEENGERGCAVLCRLSSGHRRRTLICWRAVEPEPGDVDWHQGSGGLGLYFDTEYLARVQNEAIDGRSGVLLVHNHPLDPTPEWSRVDEESEKALLRVLSRSVPGPVGSIVLGIHGSIRARELERTDSGILVSRSVSCERVVGPGLTMRRTVDAALNEPPIVVADRSIRLWGKEGQRILQNLRVGIAGAGGVGSYVAEGLARLGVGEIQQVDPDTLEEVNLNRNAGATRADVGKTKVAVLGPWLSSIATADPFHYEGHASRVQDSSDVFLDCDLIVCAVDGYDARDFLNELSYRHFVPVVDCGTQLDPDPTRRNLKHGVLRVQAVGPGNPCLWCTGFLTRERVTQDRLPSEIKRLGRYGVDESAPSVFFTNAVTTGLVGMVLLEVVLHLVGKVPGELRLNLLNWTLRPEADVRQPGCECERAFGWGDCDIPVFRPGRT